MVRVREEDDVDAATQIGEPLEELIAVVVPIRERAGVDVQDPDATGEEPPEERSILGDGRGLATGSGGVVGDARTTTRADPRDEAARASQRCPREPGGRPERTARRAELPDRLPDSRSAGRVGGRVDEDEPGDARVDIGRRERIVRARANPEENEPSGGVAGREVVHRRAGVRDRALPKGQRPWQRAAVADPREIDPEAWKPLRGEPARQDHVEPMGADAVDHTGVEVDDGRTSAPRARFARRREEADQVLIRTECDHLLARGFYRRRHGEMLRRRAAVSLLETLARAPSADDDERMPPYHFGPEPRPLFGWLHQTPRLRPRTGAVLLCNPMGEEAARAHRVYRVLATQLERAGYPVLRFDYSGTGDSAGDAADATVDEWVDDVATAAGELARAAPKARLVLVGLRLGATIAAVAAASKDLRVKHLVLWDPVTDGEEYLRDLVVAHRAYMRDERGDRYDDRLPFDAEGTPLEVLGMPLGSTLSRQIRALDLTSSAPRADHVTVVETRPSASLARLRAAIGSRAGVRWVEERESLAWNNDAALNAATVPMDVVQAIVTRIEEVCP